MLGNGIFNKVEQNYLDIANVMPNAFLNLKAVENEVGEYIDGVILEVNKAAIDFLENEEEDLINKTLSEIYNNFAGESCCLFEVLKDIKNTKSVCIQQAVNITGDKWGYISIYSFKEGYFSLIINDITEIKIYADEMTYLANYDTLTNLLNRHSLFEYIIELIIRNEEFSIYCIDLDNFKSINDVLGYNTGDEVLMELSHRLSSFNSSDEGITVGKLDGDELVLVKRGKCDKEEIKVLANRLLNLLNEKIELNKYDFTIKSSIGISLYPQDAEDIFALFKYAQTAMYEAKEKGGNNFRFFSEEMVEEINIRSKLDKAIENEEFKVYFQPLYDISKRKIVGAEALTRWITPDGIVAPLKYIPLAKKSGDIIRLDEMVLRESCKCCRRMQELGVEDFIISVNIYYVAIKQLNFIDKMIRIVEEEGISPESIKFEITEDELVDNMEFVINVLNRLKEVGFKIALDDFGNGKSSFGCIKSLPLDTIKIDRSLIVNIEEKKQLEVMEMLIKLFHVLGIEVICEGIEGEKQIELLKKISCDKIQGYYISKPITYDSFNEFIKDFNNL